MVIMGLIFTHTAHNLCAQSNLFSDKVQVHFIYPSSLFVHTHIKIQGDLGEPNLVRKSFYIFWLSNVCFSFLTNLLLYFLWLKKSYVSILNLTGNISHGFNFLVTISSFFLCAQPCYSIHYPKEQIISNLFIKKLDSHENKIYIIRYTRRSNEKLTTTWTHLTKIIVYALSTNEPDIITNPTVSNIVHSNTLKQLIITQIPTKYIETTAFYQNLLMHEFEVSMERECSSSSSSSLVGSLWFFPT